MAYLDSGTLTVDAVLTKLGREKLSQMGQGLQIVKFALADDEVDYSLWDINNSNGSAYYGEAIENMSLIEANPNETSTMKRNLITLPKNSQRLPTIGMVGGITSYTIDSGTTIPLILKMQTFNPAGGNGTLGYTATILSGAILQIEGQGVNAGGGTSWWLNQGIQTNMENRVITATGMEFSILPVAQYNQNRVTQVMISGNETGGHIVVDITVNQMSVNVLVT